MRILHTARFAKEYKKLPNHIKDEAENKEDAFRSNPFDPKLKTHKLKGNLSDFYSFSVAYHWRIVFHFEDKNTVIFDHIGTHEIYK